MAYALLKSIHLLGIVAWVGGMFFVAACLRPAAAVLDAATRVRLMAAALRRFFRVVDVAATLVLVSGAALLALAFGTERRAGVAFNMPLDWYAMVVLGLAMVAIFVHIRGLLGRRLQSAVAAEDWPAGAAALASIRAEVLVNLVIGVAIIVITRVGGAA